VLPRGSRTKAFLRDLPLERFARAAITRVEPYRSSTTLTHHQDRALKIAYTLGYFAYPRRATLGEVARALGRGRSATLETLRRATVKLAGRRYGEELGARAVFEVPPGADRRGQ
jgi:predicted DNA binding protein